MNILFICEVEWEKKVVFDVHLLAEAMSLRGHRIYAIDYESMWGDGRIKPPKEHNVSRAIPNASVWLIHPKFIRIPILSRVSAFFSHYFEIKKVIKEKKIDAIVLYSVPTNGLQAVYWAKKFNISIVFRSIDVLNQLAPHPFKDITKLLERLVYPKADRILTITPKLSEYVVGLGASPEKVSVLPMTVDTDKFRPLANGKTLRRQWGLATDDKVVLFMGTLFNFSGLDTFISKFWRVIVREQKAKLLIVGDGTQHTELDGIIKSYGLEGRVIITGFQPYQDMPQYINLADVCVNTFVSNSITRDIFPGKTVQFLACGKPLVMRPLDGVKAVISGEDQGVVYAETDDEIVVKIASLLEFPEERERIGGNGLRYARQTHSHEKVASQLEAILVGLSEEKSKA